MGSSLYRFLRGGRGLVGTMGIGYSIFEKGHEDLREWITPCDQVTTPLLRIQNIEEIPRYYQKAKNN